jgi:hypothetical protein
LETTGSVEHLVQGSFRDPESSRIVGVTGAAPGLEGGWKPTGGAICVPDVAVVGDEVVKVTP